MKPCTVKFRKGTHIVDKNYMRANSWYSEVKILNILKDEKIYIGVDNKGMKHFSFEFAHANFVRCTKTMKILYGNV